MLNAAELLGAAHQRPQQFSVMTTFPRRRNVSTRNVIIDWFYRERIPDEALITKNTETGIIHISNPLFNCFEHINVLGLVKVPFRVKNSWLEGESELTTYHLEDLLGTKLRA